MTKAIKNFFGNLVGVLFVVALVVATLVFGTAGLVVLGLVAACVAAYVIIRVCFTVIVVLVAAVRIRK